MFTSKTLAWATFMALFPTLTAYIGGLDWVQIVTSWGIPQIWIMPVAGLIGGIVTAILRFLTTSPLMKK